MTCIADALFLCVSWASCIHCCGLHKTTTQTIDYATLFVLLFAKGLNATFKYFERKLTKDGYGREFECKQFSHILKANWIIIQFAFNIMRKLSLVNETLRPETETRPRRLTFSPRRDRNRDVPTFHRDRDVGKMRLETETSRPRLHPCQY